MTARTATGLREVVYLPGVAREARGSRDLTRCMGCVAARAALVFGFRMQRRGGLVARLAARRARRVGLVARLAGRVGRSTLGLDLRGVARVAVGAAAPKLARALFAMGLVARRAAMPRGLDGPNQRAVATRAGGGLGRLVRLVAAAAELVLRRFPGRDRRALARVAGRAVRENPSGGSVRCCVAARTIGVRSSGLRHFCVAVRTSRRAPERSAVHFMAALAGSRVRSCGRNRVAAGARRVVGRERVRLVTGRAAAVLRDFGRRHALLLARVTGLAGTELRPGCMGLMARLTAALLVRAGGAPERCQLRLVAAAAGRDMLGIFMRSVTRRAARMPVVFVPMAIGAARGFGLVVVRLVAIATVRVFSRVPAGQHRDDRFVARLADLLGGHEGMRRVALGTALVLVGERRRRLRRLGVAVAAAPREIRARAVNLVAARAIELLRKFLGMMLLGHLVVAARALRADVPSARLAFVRIVARAARGQVAVDLSGGDDLGRHAERERGRRRARGAAVAMPALGDQSFFPDVRPSEIGVTGQARRGLSAWHLACGMVEKRDFGMAARASLGLRRQAMLRELVASAAFQWFFRIQHVRHVSLRPGEPPGLDFPGGMAGFARRAVDAAVIDSSAGNEAEHPLLQVLAQVILVTARARQLGVCGGMHLPLRGDVAGSARLRALDEVASRGPEAGESRDHEDDQHPEHDPRHAIPAPPCSAVRLR